MFSYRKKGLKTEGKIKAYVKSISFQRFFIAAVTFLIAFVLVGTGAAQHKYRYFSDPLKAMDFPFAAGMFFIVLLLELVLVLYLNRYYKEVLKKINELLIIGIVIILTLFIARILGKSYPLAIPVFFTAMTISVIFDLKVSIMANLVLTIAISFMTGGNLELMYVSLIGATLSAFLVSKTNQRSRLSMMGITTGAISAVIILCLGLINGGNIMEVGKNALTVLLNGIVSVVITIGMLPFWEGAFNVITPMRLLELSNPNQPLLKKLLIEAPGTYHHSLMVANLAELATESIGGDALLARVGAYYHDIGKLNRPGFFKENQLWENPHDKITPNLSTLIITSHTSDGVELGKKYKLPEAVLDIIGQHHGNTLVAYFYHKASNKNDDAKVNPENFRYEGPKPSSKEAAVVMMADSVEAAVRSMTDKTEGKIEGLIRKIIKDKLDDGQLSSCDLTLKDLDDIAKSFVKIFSGFFHQRLQYPEKVLDINNNEKVEKTQKGEDPEEMLSMKIPSGENIKVYREPVNIKDNEEKKHADYN